MRVHYDDEERALLAARLGHAESVSDADLAASFAAWVGQQAGDAGQAARAAPDSRRP